MFRAKYFVGEAVSRITRTALTLGGAHAIFKTSPWNGCFATGKPRPSSFHPVISVSAPWSVGTGADLAEMLPPLKRP